MTLSDSNSGGKHEKDWRATAADSQDDVNLHRNTDGVEFTVNCMPRLQMTIRSECCGVLRVMRESGIIAIRPWDVCGRRGVKKRFIFFLVVRAWWDLRSGVQKVCDA